VCTLTSGDESAMKKVVQEAHPFHTLEHAGRECVCVRAPARKWRGGPKARTRPWNVPSYTLLGPTPHGAGHIVRWGHI
jgi:hypothetical protein